MVAVNAGLSFYHGSVACQIEVIGFRLTTGKLSMDNLVRRIARLRKAQGAQRNHACMSIDARHPDGVVRICRRYSDRFTCDVEFRANPSTDGREPTTRAQVLVVLRETKVGMHADTYCNRSE